MNLIIVDKKISLSKLRELAKDQFGDLIKGVVDIKKEIMVVGGSLDADEEALLLKKGSKQDDLWGINIYPDLPKEKRVEFDSIINIRPHLNNNSRYVESRKIRDEIIKIVNQLIKEE